MKRVIAIAAILAIPKAFAQELKFGDVNYFLKQNQSNVSFDVNQTYYSTTDKAGTKNETRGIILSGVFSHAFTDQFNAFVGVDYAYRNITEDKTGTDKDIYSDGLSNPSLGLNFRAVNQNTSLVNIDFGAIARVNVQDAKRGDSQGQLGRDGNYADGRSSLEVNARVGRKWNEANEWQLALGGIYHTDGDQQNKSPSGDQKQTIDSSVDTYLRASYQYRPVNEFMLLTALQGNYIGETNSKLKGSGTKINAENHLDLEFDFQAKYLVTEALIVRFNYGLFGNSDYNLTGDVNDKVRKRYQNFYGLGLDYLF